MLAFVLKDGPPRRVACTNAATYAFLWPSFAAAAVPGARPLCRWAGRHGAAVHGAVRLVARAGHRGRGRPRCALVSTRDLPAGTALVSLPLQLSLSVSAGSRQQGTVAGQRQPLEELTGLIARHLHNPRSPYRQHLEFLHDFYNSGADDVENDAVVPGYRGDRAQLLAKLDGLYGGNAMHVQGVANAPFVPKHSLSTAAQRVEWVRAQSLVRRVEQSVPHFAAKSVAWALSMALARSIEDDVGGLSLFPLIDFCSHSFTPNAQLKVCATASANLRCGVKWHDHSVPCAHLVSQVPIARGEQVTRLYSPRRVQTVEDAEYWQMRWGFVPGRRS